MHYILLILIALIWGSQYIFNELALQELTPFGLMVLRIFFGFITLTLLILVIPRERAKRLHLTKKLFLLFIVIGAVEAAIPFYLIAYGQLLVASSVTAIIMGLIPMMTILLELVMRKRDKITRNEVIGLAVAFAGLIVLINPSSDNLHSTLLGFLSISIAAFCFALALILMAMIPKEISSLHATRFILMIYSLPLMLMWLFLNRNSVAMTDSTWLSVIILGIFSSGIVYLLYLKLIRLAGASFTALSNYLVPLVGTSLGVYFFNEPFTLNIALSLLLIVSALFIIKGTSKRSQ
ncbi:MAG: DMT family transporter [Sulfurimonadaceae bacterium]